MLPTVPKGFPSTYQLDFLAVRLSDLKTPEGKGLEDLVRENSKRGIILFDANVVLDGLYNYGLRPSRTRQFARKVIETLRVGQFNKYVPTIFEPSFEEIASNAARYGYNAQGALYLWLATATNKNLFVFLEHDQRAPLPDDVRDIFLRTCKVEVKRSNLKDLSTVAAAIKIANTGLDVAFVTHDADLTNALVMPALRDYGVSVYDAEALYREITQPVPKPRTALTPAAIQTMPGFVPVSPQLPLLINRSPSEPFEIQKVPAKRPVSDKPVPSTELERP